jgi:diguanylate cyclase (GGDEF)-like protein
MPKNQQAAMASEVGRLLAQGAVDRQAFAQAVDALVHRWGDEVYSVLLHTAVHLEFGKRAARRHYEAVIAHWQQLCTDTGRDVDFRVALLDYFLAINKRIKNPKIIEIKIFEQTRQETETDDLTRLYNYRYFRKAIELEVCRSQRYHAPLSLVLFDADNFKFYNDANGHMAGNKALKKLAGIIRRAVREMDVVARFGGEEFAVLLPETNKRGAFTIADRICRSVEQARFACAKAQPNGRFSISGGIATLHVDADDSTALIKKADQALYQAKARGKNQVALYVDELREYERVCTAIMGQLDCGRGIHVPVLLQDISQGGMLFSCERLLPMASHCELSFPLAGEDRQLTCKVKVRRVEEQASDRHYSIGASIVQMQPKDARALQRFIRALADLNLEPASREIERDSV